MFAMQCNAGAVYLLLVVNDSIDCSVKVVQSSVCSFWFSFPRLYFVICEWREGCVHEFLLLMSRWYSPNHLNLNNVHYTYLFYFCQCLFEKLPIFRKSKVQKAQSKIPHLPHTLMRPLQPALCFLSLFSVRYNTVSEKTTL